MKTVLKYALYAGALYELIVGAAELASGSGVSALGSIAVGWPSLADWIDPLFSNSSQSTDGAIDLAAGTALAVLAWRL